jgi:hypothetical protein
MATIAARFDAVLDALTDPLVLTAGQRQTVYEAYFAQTTDAQLRNVLGDANLVFLSDGTVDRTQVSTVQKKGMFLWRRREESRVVVNQVNLANEQAIADAQAKANAASATAGTGL